jgi:hypothetical protein
MHIDDLVKKSSPTIEEIVDCVFGPKLPLRPGSINLRFSHDPTIVNKILSNIMILGAKKLFGYSISPSNITKKQFSLLNDYFHSMNYNIKYTPNVNHNNEISGYHVIYEPYIHNVKCNGRIFTL